MNSLQQQRPTRHFADRPVEPELIENLLHTAMKTPTARDYQTWEFLVIQNPTTRLQISKMADDAAVAAGAPLLLVVMANLDNAQMRGSIWQKDMESVSENIQLRAEDEGLVAVWLPCWPYERRIDYLRPILALPAHVVPFSVIAIGYEELEEYRPAFFSDRFDTSKIHWEKY